jgi:hypothetical protein
MTTENNTTQPPPLTDFEIAKLSRLFEILIRIDQRAKQKNKAPPINQS